MSNILILPGDGIGPEIVEQAVNVLQCFQSHGLSIEIEQGLIGGAAYDQTESPLPDQTIQLACASDSILLGAVGGPQYDSVDSGC